MASKSRRNSLIVGIVVVAMCVALVWVLAATITNVSSSATLDDQTLEAKALQWARTNGLQGDPVAKRAVRMTLGQWLAFGGGGLGPGAAESGLSPDTPVFVLAIRGKVEWRQSQSPLPGQAAPEQFDNITVVVDARNGNPISVRAARDTSTMPIQVPLNALTPTTSIRFAPTQPPMTPPTRVPEVTRTPTVTPRVTATAPRVTATQTLPPSTPTVRPYP